MKKRGIALYRVSTDKQEESLQKRVVREYCKDNNIEIIDEYIELDVSRYKTALKDRKELLKILSRAEEKGDFDYLLVYIFDRIIRREDEAPFVLSILSKYNIEAIEVTTGEHIKNADMTDKLMNYIRFWNAEYESVKTSQRVTDALRTKNEQNKFTGGNPPFGYELYNTDIISKKGRILKDLKINEEEAWIVRDIFDMYVNKNMGSLSIAEELNTNLKYRGKNRPKKRKDKENPDIVHETPVRFRQSSIVKYIKNPIYIGRKRYNTIETHRDGITLLPQEEWKTQDYREDLRIISDEMFFKAQEIMNRNRLIADTEKKGITRSGVLCSGLACCECGAKLYASFGVYKYNRKDGTVNKGTVYRYACRDGREMNQIHKQKYGKTYYAAKKYDTLVEDAILGYLNNIDTNKLKDEIEKTNKVAIQEIKDNIENLRKEKELCFKNISKFENKIDDDVDNIDIYIKGIRRNEERAKQIEEEIDKLNKRLKSESQDMYDYSFICDNFKEYYNKFKSGNLDDKKIILDKIVDKIIFKNNGIKIILKTSIQKSIDSKNYVYSELHSYANGVISTQKNITTITVDFNTSTEVI